MARKPSRPSDSKAAPRAAAPKIAAPALRAFPTCEACPTTADCAFEGKCSDVAKNNGRPTLYSDALADDLIGWISSGKSQKRWCDQDGHPTVRTVQRWAQARPAFVASLTQAREEWTHSLLDEAQDIANDGSNDTYRDADGNERVATDVVQRSKLRVETNLKLAAMVNPKRYGAKLDLTSEGKALTAMSDTELSGRLATLHAAGMLPAIPAPLVADADL